MKIPVSTCKANPLRLFKSFTRNPLEFLKRYATNPDGLSRFRLLHYRMVHVSHPEHLKQIMQAGPDQYTQSRDRDHMQLLFGNGLLTSTGPHWKKQRALMQPAFGKAKLEPMLQKITTQLSRFPMPTGKPFDLHAYSLNLVNHLIAEVVFSDTSPATLEIGNVLVDLKAETLRRLEHFSLPLWVPTAQNRQYKKQRKMVNSSIQQHIANRKGTGEQHPDLLNAFRLATDKTTGHGMTEEELREELLGVYAAAHEPVAIALTYALFLLATHPAVTEKLQQELAEVLNGEEMDMEKFGSLNYTRQVVQEALRLYPPVWISGKRALKTDFLQGYEIKKNDNIIFSPVLVHRHPEFWPEPEQFIPERFDGSRKIHPFACIPFGGGAKACVGSHLAMMILQLAMAKIYNQYSLTTAVKTVAINPFTTLKPLTEMMVTATEKQEVKVMQVKRSY